MGSKFRFVELQHAETTLEVPPTRSLKDMGRFMTRYTSNCRDRGREHSRLLWLLLSGPHNCQGHLLV